MLKRKIMGPCWLQVKHPEIDNKGVGTILHRCAYDSLIFRDAGLMVQG